MGGRHFNGENENPQRQQQRQQQQYYQSLTRHTKKKSSAAAKQTTGLERSYNSITATLKSGYEHFENSSFGGSRSSVGSGRHSSIGFSSSDTTTSTYYGSNEYQRTIQQLRFQKEELRRDQEHGDTSSENSENSHSSKKRTRHSAKTPMKSNRSSSVDDDATYVVDDATYVVEDDGTFTSEHQSTQHTEGTTSTMMYGGGEERVGGGVESVPSFATSTSSSSTERKCRLEEMLLGGDGGHVDVVTGDTENMAMISQQRSRESLDTFKKEESSSTTAGGGGGGVYSAANNNTRKSMDTFKKTSQAVCKMSQASFGKIRDILHHQDYHHHRTGAGAPHNNNLIGGYRKSGIGLGAIRSLGPANSSVSEMSLYVSDNDGKVHKEKVPLDDQVVRKAFENESAMKAADGLLGGKEEKKKVSLLLLENSEQQQQEEQQNHRRNNHRESKGVGKKITTMTSTAPQSPIPTGHTPPLVRSVKKATRVVSSTVREGVDTVKYEVVPATKAMATLTAKLVERGEKKMKDGVGPKLRAVALDIDARLNHHHHHTQQHQPFVGLEHIEGKGDYVCDPYYEVTRTPEHPNQVKRRTYGLPNSSSNNVQYAHRFDPNTPVCLHGALTAGTLNYDVTHPEHPEYLPEGIPRVLNIPEDWEERAGFIPTKALMERVGGGPVDLDDAVPSEDEGDDNKEEKEIEEEDEEGLPMKYDITPIRSEEVEEAGEDVTPEEDEEEEDDDPRNHSMWVAVNPDEEDMEAQDEIMNVGEIILDNGGEFNGEDNEFSSSPRSLATGDSNTYYVGSVGVGSIEDEDKEELEEDENHHRPLVSFQEEKEQQVHVETVDEESEYDATPMKKVTLVDGGEVVHSQQVFTEKTKEFQTPFSVKKGERPMTYQEFEAMHKHKRLLFKNEEAEQRESEGASSGAGSYSQQSQAMADGNDMTNHDQAQGGMAANGYISYAAPTSMHQSAGQRQRELKGRVVMIRIKKKISKVVKKGLKQLLLAAKGGSLQASSNNSITDANFIITIPNSSGGADVPDSPSAVSIALSLMSSTVGGSKHVIGAIPVSSAHDNAAPEYLYGAVNYHNRSSDEEESEGVPENDEEDVVSFLAEAMSRGLNVDGAVEPLEADQGGSEEEEEMLLVLTPTEGGGERLSQVISSGVDGTPVVFNEVMHKNEDGSEIKPHNLSCVFDSGKKDGKSIEIMDALEVEGNIVLTPTESRHDVDNVFRRSFGGASASILPGSTIDSEDETLVTHDGNTVVRQDTYDHTITTTSSAVPSTIEEEQEEKKPPSTLVLAREEDPEETEVSPCRPAYSREAETNASFLFSPDNMGRANPRIRAKERALLRNRSNEGSITMLPSAASMGKSEQLQLFKSKPSYSFDSSAGGSKYGSAPSIASKPSVESEAPDTPSTVVTEVQQKPVVATQTNDRQFSFQSMINKFDSKDNASSGDSHTNTPVVTNAARNNYVGTAFQTANNDSSPPNNSSRPSISSFKSSGGRRLSSPKGKEPPKSALKTRKGLVKDRISMFSQRADVPSAVTGVNGRLKKNHSYRLKNGRRETNGGGALAPRKAVLQSPAFIRTVPIGIAKSYSHEEESVEERSLAEDVSVVENKPAFTTQNKQPFTQDKSFSDDDEESVEKSNSYTTHYMNASKADEQAESFGRNSLDSSSVVSETTECDAFNSLLGKMSSDYDDESVESESSEETLVRDEQKENVSKNPNVAVAAQPSSFKTGATLVKPNEITHNRTPLRAQKWRSMAASYHSSSKKL